MRDGLCLHSGGDHGTMQNDTGNAKKAALKSGEELAKYPFLFFALMVISR